MGAHPATAGLMDGAASAELLVTKGGLVNTCNRSHQQQKPAEGTRSKAGLQLVWREKGCGWGGVGALITVLVVLNLSQSAQAGKCVTPPKGSTAFCSVTYQVYIASDTQTNDTAYWFNLDKRSETLTEDWNENMGCSKSVLAGESWCKNYACSLNFPKCTSFKDAPLPICRQTCIDCFRTCTPDRPILPPGMYYPPGFAANTERTWAEQYSKITYDAWTKAYICEADHKLADGGKFLFFTMGTACTGSGMRLNTPWVVVLVSMVTQFVHQRP